MVSRPRYLRFRSPEKRNGFKRSTATCTCSVLPGRIRTRVLIQSNLISHKEIIQINFTSLVDFFCIWNPLTFHMYCPSDSTYRQASNSTLFARVVVKICTIGSPILAAKRGSSGQSSTNTFISFIINQLFEV